MPKYSVKHYSGCVCEGARVFLDEVNIFFFFLVFFGPHLWHMEVPS